MSSKALVAGRRGPGSRTQLAAALCAAGFGMAQPAWAQSADNTKTLDTVVVTASGYEQEIQDAPASISVITREDLDKKFYRDINDALVDVPGVIVTGGGDRQDISLRGMGPKYTLILIDGKRQNSRETRTNSDSTGVEGGWTPPLSAIERIEVVRGPMSSLYGSDAMGGVINIITRKVPAEWGGEIRLDTTIQESNKSGDIYQGNFYLAGPIKTDLLGLQIYGQATQRDEDDIVDGFRKRNSESVTAKLALTPNRDHDIVLEATTMRQKLHETLGKTVEPLPPGQACGRNGCPASSDTDYRSNKWALSHTGRWGWGVSDSYVQQEEFDNRSRQMKIKNLDLQTSWTLPLGSHMLTLGGSYLSQRLNDQTGNQLANGPSKVDRYQWALFAEDEWRLTESFAVTTGLRMDEDENFGTHFSPRLYGVWHMAERWTLKGGVSTGFRAPDLRQTVAGWGQVSRGGNMYGNPDLTPEKSVTEEIGILYDNGEGFNAGLTVFNNDFKDKITRVACPATQCTDGPNQFGSDPTTYMNVDKANSRGVEANLKLPLSRDWSLTSSYTFTKSEQKSGQYKGQPLNQLPKHLFTTTVNWQASDALQAWARVNYRGKESQPITGPSSSSVVAPSYTFVDLGGSYQVNKTVAVYAGIYNLFDKQVTYDDYGYVEDGRRYWLGVGVKF
ncbi:ligand-gated channel protein [Achromobacter insolitus]|jgi:outer membrane receptor for ferrienterochelin and colicins|uniref:ligand-gated channel protein n=1 Tax=Achromobacter insolitus TaxID=217204 RepID=UPI0007C2DBA5|nr:ligand-gated channel protein [Achromobacter insolitus]MCP1402709.1 outer membrane receptor for ferrienterochelin and colicins [Achromobacter insolitus]MDQ6214907.1 ligand-gated channel protein [Achromobacter insolitus]OAD13345.1 outer membrane siderophore receptor [Achromobacter insolitus]QEK92575.1 ligand-gated channel protein [Achromobacter insolitus]